MNSYKIDIIDINKENNSIVKIPSSINITIKKMLLNETIHLIYRKIMHNMHRIRHIHYKCKSMLSYSTKKLRAQKGTGRSRQGSAKQFHMRGGAVKFGVSDKNRSTRTVKTKLKINKVVNQRARIQVIENKIINNKVFIIKSWDIIPNKTLEVNKIIHQLDISNKKSLCVYNNNDLKNIKYIKNIKNIYILNICTLNILHLIKYPYLIISYNDLINITKKYDC